MTRDTLECNLENFECDAVARQRQAQMCDHPDFVIRDERIVCSVCGVRVRVQTSIDMDSAWLVPDERG